MMTTRIRSVKPELFRHEELFDQEKASQLPLRLAYIGLWTCCDREGRFRWRPRALKCDILPYDDTIDFAKVLNALADGGFVQRYEVDNEVYGVIPRWRRHQCPNVREKASQLPAPPNNKAQEEKEGSDKKTGMLTPMTGLTDVLKAETPACVESRGSSHALFSTRGLSPMKNELQESVSSFKAHKAPHTVEDKASDKAHDNTCERLFSSEENMRCDMIDVPMPLSFNETACFSSASPREEDARVNANVKRSQFDHPNETLNRVSENTNATVNTHANGASALELHPTSRAISPIATFPETAPSSTITPVTVSALPPLPAATSSTLRSTPHSDGASTLSSPALKASQKPHQPLSLLEQVEALHAKWKTMQQRLIENSPAFEDPALQARERPSKPKVGHYTSSTNSNTVPLPITTPMSQMNVKHEHSTRFIQDDDIPPRSTSSVKNPCSDNDVSPRMKKPLTHDVSQEAYYATG